MITVHHLNNSRSQRILWLLEELALDYEITKYHRDPETQLAPAALKAVHPLGKSPVITDGSVTLPESGAIIEYLIDTYGAGRLKPAPGTDEALRYLKWMHYAEGSAMPPLLMGLVFNQVEKAKAPIVVNQIKRAITQQVMKSFIQPQISLHIGYMEDQLAHADWFAGPEFTAADIQMSFPLEAADTWGAIGTQTPRLRGFLDRIRTRPAYQRALEKGGPFKLFS